MKRTVSRVVFAVALVAVGWAAGRAQSPLSAPDFEIVIRAPVGATVVECVRGCGLLWVERGDPGPGAETGPTFEFACRGASVHECRSGRIGGWIKH